MFRRHDPWHYGELNGNKRKMCQPLQMAQKETKQFDTQVSTVILNLKEGNTCMWSCSYIADISGSSYGLRVVKGITGVHMIQDNTQI